MATDKYANFAALSECEREGVDFRVCVSEKNSTVAIIAPHGGKIEPRTSEIAAAIAGNTFNFYCFEGTKENNNHSRLHIKSGNFDEPRCRALVQKSDVVIAVHGLGGNEVFVDVGGLDSVLRNVVYEQLLKADFDARIVAQGDHAAISQDNICNRGQRARGVQLEITKGLRDCLNGPLLAQFADAVRTAVGDR
jgi:phage replication-related protein YjqB (UPF0714/DUF867 family)